MSKRQASLMKKQAVLKKMAPDHSVMEMAQAIQETDAYVATALRRMGLKSGKPSPMDRALYEFPEESRHSLEWSLNDRDLSIKLAIGVKTVRKWRKLYAPKEFKNTGSMRNRKRVVAPPIKTEKVASRPLGRLPRGEIAYQMMVELDLPYVRWNEDAIFQIIEALGDPLIGLRAFIESMRRNPKLKVVRAEDGVMVVYRRECLPDDDGAGSQEAG